MELLKKIAISLFILFLFALFLWAVFAPEQDISKKISETLKQQTNIADLFFKGVTFAEIVNGIKYWEFKAVTSDVNKDTKLALMNEVNGLFFKNGKPTLKIIAPNARWQMLKKDIRLNEPIGFDIKYENKIKDFLNELKTSKELFSFFNLPSKYSKKEDIGYWFKAHNLNWSMATKQMICEGGIVLTKGNLTVFCEKLEGDVGLEKVRLTGKPRAIIQGKTQDLVTIEATSFDIDSPNDLIYAKENIIFTRGQARITANDALFDQKINQVKLHGNIYVVFEDIKAWGNNANYFVDEEKIELTGDARALRKQNRLVGDKVIIFIKDGKIAIEGKTKVTIGKDDLNSK